MEQLRLDLVWKYRAPYEYCTEQERVLTPRTKTHCYDPNGYGRKLPLLPLQAKRLGSGCFGDVYSLGTDMAFKSALLDSTFIWLCMSLWARRHGELLDIMPVVHGLEIRGKHYFVQMERLHGLLRDADREAVSESAVMYALSDEAGTWIEDHPHFGADHDSVCSDIHNENVMHRGPACNEEWVLTDPGSRHIEPKAAERYLEIALSD